MCTHHNHKYVRTSHELANTMTIHELEGLMMKTRL